MDNLAKALSELLEQIECLRDIEFSLDVEPYKAEANWDDAVRRAQDALLQAERSEGGSSNPVDDGAVERATHPEAQGNKDLGEPQTSFAWQKIETAPRGRKLIVGYMNDCGNWRTVMACYYLPKTLDWNSDYDGGDEDGFAPEGWYEEIENSETIFPMAAPTHWTPLPPPPSERSEAAPTTPQPIKGESDAEKAERDLRLFGTAVMRDGKHVPLEEIYLTPEEIELASNGMGLR